MIFPTKLSQIDSSIFSKMSQLALQHEAINLSQGFPNFKSDPLLIDLVSKAFYDGHNQYAPMPGDFQLREAIAKKTSQLYNRTYNLHTEITITAGATQAIFTVLAASIHPGDEVIVFTPAYDCYEPTIKLFGGVPKAVQLKPPTYSPDWNLVEETISPKTKMIIINTPHNPTGTLFSKEDMLILQALCEKNNVLVLSDEVYEHIVFDDHTHYSAAMFNSLAERTFITASFGKTFHNTGWKIGYCMAPKPLMEAFQKIHQFNVFCVNHPIQKALATYLENPSHYLQLGEFYQQKRDYFLSLLSTSRFTWIPSKGTYFQLLDFSEITQEHDVAFAERLTKEQKVATIPTSVFNKNKEDFKQIRVCFAKTEDVLLEAANILNSI